ncbi:hypothetical protein MTO96_005852 [Rhipicephalus appendiculatus]
MDTTPLSASPLVGPASAQWWLALRRATKWRLAAGARPVRRPTGSQMRSVKIGETAKEQHCLNGVSDRYPSSLSVVRPRGAACARRCRKPVGYRVRPERGGRLV